MCFCSCVKDSEFSQCMPSACDDLTSDMGLLHNNSVTRKSVVRNGQSSPIIADSEVQKEASYGITYSAG